MRLTTWKGDTFREDEVIVARNYLTETEIDELNRFVVMFLDCAEDQARQRKQVLMSDWTIKLDECLRCNDRSALPEAVLFLPNWRKKKAKLEYAKSSERRRAAREAQAEWCFGSFFTIRNLNTDRSEFDLHKECMGERECIEVVAFSMTSTTESGETGARPVGSR